jgi:4-hydroxybenzoate polyprenyltransferase
MIVLSLEKIPMPARKNNRSRRVLKVAARKIRPYLQIIRVDHWFKNVFMLFGVLLAYFILPVGFSPGILLRLAFAFAATCLIASSNYVLNEILDAPTDRHHPVKKNRPVAVKKVRIRAAYVQWICLSAAGIGMAFTINRGFGFSGMIFWILGLLYNMPPFRTKEIPYLDVLSEALNNPVRLLLGWFTLIPNKIPPVSLLIAYWMLGSFLMALKRFAEYREIGDRKTASLYRASFAHYNADRLMLSSFFYAVIGSLFTSVFIVKYHLELIFFLPAFALYLTYYFKLALQKSSPVQNPERLFQERNFVLYTLACILLFVVMLLVHIPSLYNVFQFNESSVPPLWTVRFNAPPAS